MTFSDLVPSREFAGEGKTGFEPWRTGVGGAVGFGCQPGMNTLSQLIQAEFVVDYWHSFGVGCRVEHVPRTLSKLRF